MTDMEKTIIDDSFIIDGRITEGACMQDESLVSVVIPEGVTDIGEAAFYGCANLKHVVFPESLKIIREESFGDTGLEEAMLPSGLEVIEEDAFYSCGSLRRIEVPGMDTVIGKDAFGCCDHLLEGYIAAGFPGGIRHHEELQYTLLWCSCPAKHSADTCARAEAFIHKYEDLIMEWVIKYNNVPAMSGIARLGLLNGGIDRYIRAAGLAGRSEITALLMSMRGGFDESEFEL